MVYITIFYGKKLTINGNFQWQTVGLAEAKPPFSHGFSYCFPNHLIVQKGESDTQLTPIRFAALRMGAGYAGPINTGRQLIRDGKEAPWEASVDI